MIDEKRLALQYNLTLRPIGVRTKGLLLAVLLIAVDYLVILAAIRTAYLIRAVIVPQFIPSVPAVFDVPSLYMYIVVPCAYILFMHFDNLYTRRLFYWQQVERIFKVSVYAMIFVVMLMYLSAAAKEISRIFVLLAWAVIFVYLAASKTLFRGLLSASGLWRVPIVLIGAGKTAELLINAFKRDSSLGYEVVGLVEDNPKAGMSGYPVIGTFNRAEEAVRRTEVRDVFIAAPGLPREALLNLVYRLQPYVDNITFVPDLFGIPVGDMQLDTLFAERAVLLRIRNNLANEYNRLLKYCFDLIFGLLGVVVCLPLFALIAGCIYLDSPGPVIFAHNRIGKNGRTFACYKFRSMVVNAQQALQDHLAANPAAREEWEREYKLKNDPRITRVGAFLRRTSLDELPQLLNVLKGEMSLVGPRPIVAAEIAKYGEYIHDFYLVRPGVTGLWQVSGRSDVSYDDRVRLDSWYVRNWSLWLDMMVIVKTASTVLKGRGAY